MVAIGVSVAAIAWAFSGVDLVRLKDKLENTRATTILILVLTLLVIHAVRIVRYGLLVRPLGRPSWRSITSAFSIGISAAVFLPLRLGELVRPLAISRAGVNLPGALASVIVERVADGVINVGLFFMILLLLPSSAALAPELRPVAFVMLAGFGGLLVFLVAAYVARTPVLGLLERIVGRISPNVAKKIVDLMAMFLDGVAAIASWRRFLSFLFLSAVYWTLTAWTCYFIANAYGVAFPMLGAWFAITCVVFAITVPAAPGFAGTLEAGYRVGMAPFGVSASDAALVAIVIHVVTLVMLAIYAGVGVQLASSLDRSQRPAAR
jgi:uncharacterized protein (TIRG00374 family)